MDNKQLCDKAEQAWNVSWQRFFRPETNLFYDYVTSKDPLHSQDHLPTIQEVQRQFPNTCGWGTGMEDSAISAWVWMAIICDRFEANGDMAMKAAADKIWAGMALLMKVSKSPGFLARRVRIAEAGEWLLHAGHDGGVRVFVDGQPVGATVGAINHAPYTRTQARVALAAGEHEIVVALDRAGGRGWGIFVTFEIPDECANGGREQVFPEPK